MLGQTFHKCWEGAGGDVGAVDGSVRGPCRRAAFVVGVTLPPVVYADTVDKALGRRHGKGNRHGATDAALTAARLALRLAWGAQQAPEEQHESEMEAFIRRIAAVAPVA